MVRQKEEPTLEQEHAPPDLPEGGKVRGAGEVSPAAMGGSQSLPSHSREVPLDSAGSKGD